MVLQVICTIFEPFHILCCLQYTLLKSIWIIVEHLFIQKFQLFEYPLISLNLNCIIVFHKSALNIFNPIYSPDMPFQNTSEIHAFRFFYNQIKLDFFKISKFYLKKNLELSSYYDQIGIIFKFMDYIWLNNWYNIEKYLLLYALISILIIALAKILIISLKYIF